MLHVYPLHDEKEHETEGTTCWCDPILELENPNTGEVYSEIIVIHNSADGRELIEQAEEIWQSVS